MNINWEDFWKSARDADIQEVAQRVGAKLKPFGPHLIGACPNGCAKRDGFVVTPAKSIFRCRPSRASGDVIEMVAHVNGCSAVEAAEWITEQARPERSRDESPKERAARLAIAAQRATEREKREATELDERERAATRTRRLIKAYIREIVPVRATAGERYLRVERGIDTDAIADVLERVDAVGWHPAMFFNEPGHPLHGQKLGAIVSVMTDAVMGRPTGAIARTYLHGGKKITKAKALGSPAGIVRLSCDEDVLSGLHLAEGLETALDAMARGFRPMWATGSANLMASFPMLGGIAALTIFADNDVNGVGLRAAVEAAERWLAAGREVHVFQRETPGDFNDAYREVGR